MYGYSKPTSLKGALLFPLYCSVKQRTICIVKVWAYTEILPERLRLFAITRPHKRGKEVVYCTGFSLIYRIKILADLNNILYLTASRLCLGLNRYFQSIFKLVHRPSSLFKPALNFKLR